MSCKSDLLPSFPSSDDLKLKYSWSIDMVWRTRSWKNILVIYDKKSGRLNFLKPDSEKIFHSRIYLYFIYIYISFISFYI